MKDIEKLKLMAGWLKVNGLNNMGQDLADIANNLSSRLNWARIPKIAVGIAEKIEPKLTDHEQCFFLAGFIEAIKYVSNFSEELNIEYNPKGAKWFTHSNLKS